MSEDLALVYLLGEAEEGDAGSPVAESDRVGDGGGTAVLGEEAGVEAEDATRELVDNLGRENVAKGGHNPEGLWR